MSEPTKEYGFVFCEATDPEREQFWNVHKYVWQDEGHHVGCHDCKHWRKRVKVPDGWELVPEGETIPAGAEYWSESRKAWLACCSTIGKTASLECEGKDYYLYPAFIRRKSEPEPEPKMEFGNWIRRSDSEPMSKTRKHVLVSDGKHVWSEELPLWKGATHWMPLPPPPAPEKSDAEEAWDDWAGSFDAFEGTTLRSAFIAGFNAAKQ